MRFGDLYLEASRNGLTKPRSIRGNGIRFINMGELFESDWIGDVQTDRVPVTDKEMDTALLKERDLLFARQSLVREGAGKCSIITSITEPTTFDSHLIRVRLDEDKANPFYYQYFFRSPLSPMPGIVTQCAQAGIKGTDLAALDVPCPKLEEQNRVASILMTYDNLIKNNHRQIALLEEAAQRLYKEWFVDLRFPGYEDAVFIDGLPTGWQRMPVADYADVVKGCSYKTENIDVEQGVPMVNLASIASWGGYKPYTERTYGGAYKSEQVLDANDVVMALTEQTAGLAGYVARIPRYAQGSVPSMDLACLRPKKGSRTYLYCTCRYGDVSRLLSPLANGTKIKHLKPEALSYTEMVVAPTELQQRFEDTVHPMFTSVDVLMEQNEKLRVARDLLLPKLMSGEIGVEG